MKSNEVMNILTKHCFLMDMMPAFNHKDSFNTSRNVFQTALNLYDEKIDHFSKNSFDKVRENTHKGNHRDQDMFPKNEPFIIYDLDTLDLYAGRTHTLKLNLFINHNTLTDKALTTDFKIETTLYENKNFETFLYFRTNFFEDNNMKHSRLYNLRIKGNLEQKSVDYLSINGAAIISRDNEHFVDFSYKDGNFNSAILKLDDEIFSEALLYGGLKKDHIDMIYLLNDEDFSNYVQQPVDFLSFLESTMTGIKKQNLFNRLLNKLKK